MSTNNKNFPQQEAPEKNTDQAFVQVGKDGQPVIPQTGADENSREEADKNDRFKIDKAANSESEQ